MAFCDDEKAGTLWGVLTHIAWCTRCLLCGYDSEEVCEGVLTVASLPGGFGNAGDFATTTKDLVGSLYDVRKLLNSPAPPINAFGICLRSSKFMLNTALVIPSAFTSYLVAYANSLEFKEFLKVCLNTPVTCLRMLELIPRTLLATGNFFYNALLNNWSALSGCCVYALIMGLSLDPMSWPVLLAMIIPQVIGTITNMPVYDAFKVTLFELKNAAIEVKKIFAGLNTGETSWEDLKWAGLKMTGILLAAVIALFTDIPYFFAAYQGFARYGGDTPKLWLKRVSLFFAFAGGVDVPIVAKTIYRTAEKMIKNLYTGQCHCYLAKKSMLIVGCSLIGGLFVWRMGAVDLNEIEKITQETLGLLLKNTKSIEDALKFIVKFISPACMVIGGFFLVKDKIDREEVFDMLDNFKQKLCGSFEEKASVFRLSNCRGLFFENNVESEDVANNREGGKLYNIGK